MRMPGRAPFDPGSPGAVVRDDLAGFVVVDVLAVVADRPIGRLDEEVARHLDQSAIFPLALLDDARRHASDDLGVRRAT